MLPATSTCATTAGPSPTVSPPPMRQGDGENEEDEFLFGCDDVDPADDLFFENLDASEAFASPAAVHPLPPIPDPAPLPLFPMAESNNTSVHRITARTTSVSESTSVIMPPATSFSPQLDRFTTEGISAIPEIPAPLAVFPGDNGSAGDGLLSSVVRVNRLCTEGRVSRTMTGTAIASATAGASSTGIRRDKQEVILMNPDLSPTSAGTSYRTVCMLVVGASSQERPAIETTGARGTVALAAQSCGVGLAEVISMLTQELDRHGLKPEIDQVSSGERAVQRVKALARHGLRYRMVVLGVEGSLARSAATARDLR